MAARSKIEWTEMTWNVVTGCNKVSQGCKFCYAEVMHKRLMSMEESKVKKGLIKESDRKYSRPFLDGAFPHEPSLTIPLHMKKPRMIFVNSMSDLFHESVPFEFIAKVFYAMRLSKRHTYQVLTKRPDRMLEFLSHVRYNKYSFCYTHNGNPTKLYGGDGEIVCWKDEFPLKNVWLGVSVEDQKTADERIPILLQVPAAVRWLSAEPLLGKINLFNYLTSTYNDRQDENGRNKWAVPHLDWVVAGGESGKGARPMHPDWVRSIRDQCKVAGVPFYMKQICENGRKINYEDFPKDLKIREYPIRSQNNGL